MGNGYPACPHACHFQGHGPQQPTQPAQYDFSTEMHWFCCIFQAYYILITFIQVLTKLLELSSVNLIIPLQTYHSSSLPSEHQVQLVKYYSVSFLTLSTFKQSIHEPVLEDVKRKKDLLWSKTQRNDQFS